MLIRKGLEGVLTDDTMRYWPSDSTPAELTPNAWNYSLRTPSTPC